MVKVDFVEAIATITNYRWRCKDVALRLLLNTMLDPEGAEAADPDPDFTAAQAAVRSLGYGKIVHHDPPPEGVPGRVY